MAQVIYLDTRPHSERNRSTSPHTAASAGLCVRSCFSCPRCRRRCQRGRVDAAAGGDELSKRSTEKSRQTKRENGLQLRGHCGEERVLWCGNGENMTWGVVDSSAGYTF